LALGVKRTVYIHINNTNPVLDDHSPEHRYLVERGIDVGLDGMDVEV
jgi:pyrroloquinoline quinone biosynthesis protein B